MNRIVPSAGLALLAAGLVGIARVAAAPVANDAMPIDQAKISLAQAIAAAEQKVPGKASRAEYEQGKDGKWIYDIEVVSGAKVFEVHVDASSGSVLSSAEDSDDHDDGHDEKD